MFFPIAVDPRQTRDGIVICKDGTFRASATAVVHLAGPTQTKAAITTWARAEIEADINNFVLRRPGSVSLIDAGLGDAWGPEFGHSRSHLKRLGIAPDEVTAIYLTHVHHDHVLGLFDGPEPYFPSARIYLAASEAEFLRSPANRGPYGALFAAILTAYGEDRVHLISEGQIGSDIEAIALPGHSVGHMGYLVRSHSQTVFFCGDAFHLASLQIPDPDIGLIYDQSPIDAANSRRKTLSLVSQNGWLLAGGHIEGFLQFPDRNNTKIYRKVGL